MSEMEHHGRGKSGTFSFNFWRTQVLFVGPLIPLIFLFWWHFLWVSKLDWATLFTLGRGIHVTCSLRLISGAKPADLLVVTMAAELSTNWAMPAQLESDIYIYMLSFKRKTTLPSCILTKLNIYFFTAWLNLLHFFFKCIEINTGDTYFNTEEEKDWVFIKDRGSGKRRTLYYLYYW